MTKEEQKRLDVAEAQAGACALILSFLLPKLEKQGIISRAALLELCEEGLRRAVENGIPMAGSGQKTSETAAPGEGALKRLKSMEHFARQMLARTPWG